MKRILLACVLLAGAGPAAWSGVVMKMEQTASGSSSAAASTVYASDEMLRIDQAATGSAGRMSTLFRADTLWLVDHDEERVHRIDRESMERLGARLDDAMKQMEAQLANLPPEQRAMVEQMMKGKMPAGMPGVGHDAAPRRIETGATERVGEYSCTVQTMFSGDEEIWETCAADASEIGAAGEALEAFRALSRFTDELMQELERGPFAEMLDTPLFQMDDIDGFPVRVRTFDEGRVATETTLRSVERRDLDRALFEVPEGYRIEDPSERP